MHFGVAESIKSGKILAKS